MDVRLANECLLKNQSTTTVITKLHNSVSLDIYLHTNAKLKCLFSFCAVGMKCLAVLFNLHIYYCPVESADDVI